MQPIKTTNAMNPAPAKGIESFPTPVIDDVVISEIVNSWKGDYQPLEYGTLWKDVSHAPNQGSFPEHKLVYQQPTSEDGQWVKRIWVNDRVNQDSYNYAIKYSAGSQEHPIYIRTYIVPRETYAPLSDGTPDPLFPGAFLVDEEAVRNEGELDSKYITVTRVYETLPGPAVPTRRYNERGDLETVIVQTVPPNTPPTADGLLVTQSQVEQVETGKGVKTTATVQDHALLQIKEKKEGLLGETVTTDDIVSPSTEPDALSTTIIASTVEQYTATKARKRTTTSTSPTSLSQKSKDGKLLGDIISTESIVPPNTNPDAVSSAILSSEVKQVDSGKAIKRNVVLNSIPTLSGNQNEQGLLGVKSTTETIVNAGASADPLSLSVISSVVEPIDSVRSRKVTVNSTSPMTLSGGQNKEGLLGETDVKESIVAAGASPDALSQTVISSVIEPIDSAKSRKVTITSNGPTSLTESTKDGKLLGDIVSTESIVAPNETPDAPSYAILSSQVKQIDNGKAVKTNVILNSIPTLSGGQSGEGLLGTKDTVETIVAAGTSPDAVSLTVISSSVEPIDSVRSRKITVNSTGPTSLSGGQNKEGLLGETSVDESIVATGSSPDALSQTVISSVVEPIDTAKSRKVTITSNGPFSLSQKSNDGKLLGDTITTESVVSPNQNPDSVSSTILSSEVRQVDSGKAILRNVVLNSTPTLSGNQNEQGLLGTKSTTESIVDAGSPADPLSLSIISSTVEPIDSVRSRKVTVESTGPTSLSGGQNKEGLLGETIVEETIVAAGVLPDTLSQTIISSVIEPIDSSKSRKVTITATGPAILTESSNDGKLLGNITSTESIVAPNAIPDPVSSTIISSQVKQLDSGKAVKTNVVLNATPTLSGNQNEQGLLGNKLTTESIVDAGTSADAVSLSVISSVVEPIDSARSRKITVESTGPLSLSGGQNKDGLLGETTVNESIVAAGELPDALSQTVISSVVEPIDSSKSKKITITSSGPASLEQKSKDGKLLGDVIITESIVSPGDVPDSPTSTLLSSEVKQIDSGKAVKRNTELASTPTLIGGQSGEGLLGTKTTTETIVPSGTPPDDVSFSVISSQVEPIDSVRSRKATVESTGPTLLQAISLFDSVLGQVPATVEQSIVDPSASASGGKMILQDQITPIDSAKSKRETVTVSSYPDLISYDLDEQLGVVIINERKVVDHGSAYTENPLIISSNDKPIDQWKTLRITSRLSSLPPQRIEYKTQQFTFPALLNSVTVNSLNLGFGRVPVSLDESEYHTGINQYVSIQPDLRPALSLPVAIKIITNFSTTPPSPDPIYQITTQNISFNGSLFSFNFGDVLCNSFTIGPITASSFDMRYSGLSESISFPASSPSRSSYSIGNEVVIFSDVEYYRSNIWFKRTGYVTLV